jgi:hypothetical protein
MTGRLNRSPFSRRLRWAGLFLVSGLLIQALTLGWAHPLAFTVFIGPGFLLVGIGAAVFLWAVFEQSQVGWNQLDDEST